MQTSAGSQTRKIEQLEQCKRLFVPGETITASLCGSSLVRRQRRPRRGDQVGLGWGEDVVHGKHRSRIAIEKLNMIQGSKIGLSQAFEVSFLASPAADLATFCASSTFFFSTALISGP